MGLPAVVVYAVFYTDVFLLAYMCTGGCIADGEEAREFVVGGCGYERFYVFCFLLDGYVQGAGEPFGCGGKQYVLYCGPCGGEIVE